MAMAMVGDTGATPSTTRVQCADVLLGIRDSSLSGLGPTWLLRFPVFSKLGGATRLLALATNEADFVDKVDELSMLMYHSIDLAS